MTDTTTVATILNLKGGPNPNVDVGIEIEAEFTNSHVFNLPKTWGRVADGSLRNYGSEFVSSPLKWDDQAKADLKKVCLVINEKEPIRECVRTSVHVHINMSHRTVVEMWTGILSSLLVEDLMIKTYCAPWRYGNLFCLPVSQAYGIVKNMEESIGEVAGVFHPFADPGNRYAGLNLCSLPKFGTVEIRTKDGETDKPETIERWVSDHVRIFDTAIKAYTNPEEMFESYLALDPLLFLARIGVSSENISDFEKKGLDIRKTLREAAHNIFTLCYGTDWVKYQTQMDKYFLGKKKKKPSIADGVPVGMFNLDNVDNWVNAGVANPVDNIF